MCKTMTAPNPLKGLELVDCARANAKQGLETAAAQCGYGTDLKQFEQALEQACEEIGLKFYGLSDLVTDQQKLPRPISGIEVAPDSPSEL